MNILFSGFFWSGALIILGLGLILNFVLKTKIPFFRIFFALFFIYIGVMLLIGTSGHRSRSRTVSGERTFTVTGSERNVYSTVFGETSIDLTRVELRDQVVRQEANVIFGSGIVRIDPGMPVRAEVSAAFGEAVVPDGNTVSFGSYVYRSPGFDERKPYLAIKASVVFGRFELVAVARVPPPVDSSAPGAPVSTPLLPKPEGGRP